MINLSAVKLACSALKSISNKQLEKKILGKLDQLEKGGYRLDSRFDGGQCRVG